MKLVIKNFDKESARLFSLKQETQEIINLDIHGPPAIKKSSMSLSDVQVKAIKKSSISIKNPGEILAKTPEEPPNKFLKIEKNEQVSRAKKPEENKLSVLVKMRDQYCSSKNPSTKTAKKENAVKTEELFTLSSSLQSIINVGEAETIENIEYAFRLYLRTNAKMLVNSYDFSENQELCRVFGRSQIRYLDIRSFIVSNSTQVN